jgi:hypothetical protein
VFCGATADRLTSKDAIPKCARDASNIHARARHRVVVLLISLSVRQPRIEGKPGESTPLLTTMRRYAAFLHRHRRLGSMLLGLGLVFRLQLLRRQVWGRRAVAI